MYPDGNNNRQIDLLEFLATIIQQDTSGFLSFECLIILHRVTFLGLVGDTTKRKSRQL